MFFFFNDTATTEIYTLSLHDALPIFGVDPRARSELVARERRDGHHPARAPRDRGQHAAVPRRVGRREPLGVREGRSEEHTSELQSRQYLVCRLLLEKKKTHTRHRYDQ